MRWITTLITISLFLGIIVVGADIVQTEISGIGHFVGMYDGADKERVGGDGTYIYSSTVEDQNGGQVHKASFEAEFFEQDFHNKFKVSANNKYVGKQQTFDSFNLKDIDAEVGIVNNPAILQSNLNIRGNGTFNSWIWGATFVPYTVTNGDETSLVITKSHPTSIAEYYGTGAWNFKQNYEALNQPKLLPSGDWLGSPYLPAGTGVYTQTPPTPIITTPLDKNKTTIDEECIPSEPTIEAPTTQTNSITELTNQMRAEQGLPALVNDAQLQELAQLRAEDLASYSKKLGRTYLSHTTPTYGPTQDAMINFGIISDYGGENIAAANNGSVAFNIWASETPPYDGHLQNLINPNFQRTGVGSAKGYGVGEIYVQMFAGDMQNSPL